MITLKGLLIFLQAKQFVFSPPHRVDGNAVVLLHVLIVEVPLGAQV